MAIPAHQAKYFIHDQNRQHGEIGSLKGGMAITVHRISMRLEYVDSVAPCDTFWL